MGEVGGWLGLLLDCCRIHAGPETAVVSAEFAVDPPLAAGAALAPTPAHERRHVPVHHPPPEETLQPNYQEMNKYSLAKSFCLSFVVLQLENKDLHRCPVAVPINMNVKPC